MLDSCPKNMQYGPCGGVTAEGGCEIHPDAACVFLPEPTVRWRGAEPDEALGSLRARDLWQTLGTRQIVVADFPARALDAESLTACAAVLGGRVDAVLAGDSGAERVQFPPAYRARLMADAGLTVWAGVNCRDRNRVALEAEFAALAHAGVAAVHCVTGDHPLTGSRPDAAPVFDLDSTEAAALAREYGHLVSVAEAPASPPTGRRAARLLEKQHAGAQVCFVNHAGGAAAVDAFLTEFRALGGTLPAIACVPVVTDHASAQLLASFTNLVLPEGFLEGILRAADPRAAGIEAAVALGRDLLGAEGVAGINLSGGAGLGAETGFATALAEIGEELARTAEDPIGAIAEADA